MSSTCERISSCWSISSYIWFIYMEIYSGLLSGHALVNFFPTSFCIDLSAFVRKHSCTVFWDRHWSWSDLCFALVQCGYLYALQEMQPTLAVLHASASENFVLFIHWRPQTETYPIETTTENHPWTLWISRNHLPLTNPFERSQPRCPLLWQTQLPKARLCLRGFGGPVWIGLTPCKTQSFAASQRLLQNLRTSLCIVFDPVRFIYWKAVWWLPTH